MNKKNYMYLLFLLLPAFLYAHTLILNVKDNKNNTITVKGFFDTGELASEALIRLEALATGEILYKKRLPQSSELTIKIPTEPYQIVLDAGPEFQEVAKGIAPINGFTKNIKSNNEKKELSKPRDEDDEWSTALTVTIFLAFSLLFLAIVISIINTNRIIKQLKK